MAVLFEKRTEPYAQYREGASQKKLAKYAKSIDGAVGCASWQVNAMRVKCDSLR